MSNYVSLDQAAKMLGMSADKLNELRIKNEIFGTREGSDWKFKQDEIARFASDQGISLGDAGSADLSLSDSADLVTDEADDLSFGSSDIALAAASSGNVLGDEEPGEGSPSDTGKMSADSPIDEEELFEGDLVLQESASFEGDADLSSDFESDDLLLDDSDSDSDEIDLDSADTGISLGPTDSGIALEEEPLELGGSDIDSLELPEDDEVISLEEVADADSGSDFPMSDDDFNLTPLEDSVDDDLSSGSQVIALEDSAIYTDDSAPTMLSEDDAMQPGMVSADPVAYDAGAAQMAADGPVVLAPPEAPYSIWNVLALCVAFVIVTLLTLVTIDLARNMWQPNGVTLSNSIVNFFLRLFGWDVQS